MIRIFLLVCAAIVSVSALADPIEDFYLNTGPYRTVRELKTGPNEEFALFAPANPGIFGIRHPVITWGNGTFITPEFYNGFLTHLASYGFVVIAPRSGFVGSGAQMLDAVDWVIAQNDDPTSILFGAIDTDAIGATGHSQGGGGAINAGVDPRLQCTAPIEPTPGDVENLQGPMFVIAGGNDNIVPAASIEAFVYDPALVPTVYGVNIKANHLDALGMADAFRGYITAWFSYCLKDSPIATQAFTGACTLCDNPKWAVQRKNGQ